MRRRLKPDTGLTLLELIIAIAILAIGSIAAIRATDQSRIAIGGETPRLLARIAARNRAEELQLLGAAAALPDTVMQGGHAIAVSVATEATAGGLVQATVTARAETGEGAQLILYLPPRVTR
ncbi:type II secretion system protein I [Thalassovita gelatinovora]|uniref:Type II secretion system protein I n=1 Tax=Thalassovita gelatinovora TaxID=53501 RepID=A0A0P1FU19_THAGE|nr:prepilin-type N-terminal cleavage/methylation domain-containing protein [Thalassovita gelatinovora]QIZ80950.1 prepilin-type N-terminal cleavage/methylation domain-containing protein [Thalassovita gelatinovora]CUH63477.1 type II secretion system protein I [Thalassovita gelatinovora]SEQ67540.1 type II secretion system protein I [Thalassovita gelatinovora]